MAFSDDAPSKHSKDSYFNEQPRFDCVDTEAVDEFNAG